MATRPPHHPPPPIGGPHEWIVNEEKMRSLQEAGERLQQIGRLISERGYVSLDGNDVKPADPCLSITRYERMPRGELSLKLELLWEDVPRPSEPTKTDADVKIE